MLSKDGHSRLVYKGDTVPYRFNGHTVDLFIGLVWLNEIPLHVINRYFRSFGRGVSSN